MTSTIAAAAGPILAAACLALMSAGANAVLFYWTDWTGADLATLTWRSLTDEF
jgi:hypothetical protein